MTFSEVDALVEVSSSSEMLTNAVVTTIICFIILTSMTSESRKTRSTKSGGVKNAKSTNESTRIATKRSKITKTTTQSTTKESGPPMKWFTLPSPERTPSTDSWDEALGFNKIQIVDRIIDPTRGDLDEKYFCERDDKLVRKGSHYFEHDKCLVWHCPKWPIPVGVYDFVYYNCTDIDVRMFPLYHKECRVHRCRTKRINLNEPYILPTVPAEYRTVQTYWTGTIFSESREWD